MWTSVTVGESAGLTSSFYGMSESGYFSFQYSMNASPWNLEGRLYGDESKEWMSNYRRTLGILVCTDDEVDQRNGITLDPFLKDEHGPVPDVKYTPTRQSRRKRRELAKIAADILYKAGAKKVLRADWPGGIMFHMESTMRMGYVVDENCEAYQVNRLYIADNSVILMVWAAPIPPLPLRHLLPVLRKN